MTIFNKYKGIFNNIIDSLNANFLNLIRLIDKKSCNMLRFKTNLIRFLNKNYLNKHILDKLL